MAGLECDSGAALLHDRFGMWYRSLLHDIQVWNVIVEMPYYDSQVWNVSEQIRKNVEAAEMSREASVAITMDSQNN